MADPPSDPETNDIPTGALSNSQQLIQTGYAIHKLVPFIHHCCCKGKRKRKGHPRTGHEPPEGVYMYSSNLHITSVLGEGGWSTPCPGRFTPGKHTVPIEEEAGWATGLVWTGAVISPLLGFDPLDRMACSKVLYRLSYPSPLLLYK